MGSNEGGDADGEDGDSVVVLVVAVCPDVFFGVTVVEVAGLCVGTEATFRGSVDVVVVW